MKFSSLFFVCASVLASCSKPDKGIEPAREPAQFGVQRVPLMPLAGADISQSSRQVAELIVPEGMAPWKVIDGDFRVDVREDEQGRKSTRIRVGTKGPRAISIPGPFDPASFNRVRVNVLGEGARLDVAFRREGHNVASAPARGLLMGRATTSIDFDFPTIRSQRQPLDELVLTIQGVSPCVVMGLELRYEPPWSPFPDPWGPNLPIAVHGESRTGVGLYTGNPLRATFDVPVRGRMGFSVAVPAQVRGPNARLRLLATIDPGPKAQSKSFALPKQLDDRWQWFELDLEHIAPGNEVEVKFALEVEGDQTALCAIAEPKVYSARAPSDEPPPTVVLITSDTHRGDYLGAANSAVQIDTPNLDKLAARSIFFEDARSSTNVTLPSHSALFTGLPARDVGVYSNHGALADAAPTLAEEFRDAGYATFASTSNVSLLGWNGLGQGFDRAVCPAPSGVSDAEQTLDALLAWLPEATDQPLFVWLHFFDAHHPYEPPGSFNRRYYPTDRDPFDANSINHEVPDGLLPPDMQGLADIAFPEAQYRAEITYLDDQLARVFDHPRLGHGILSITADHGELFGEGDVWFSHAGLYPGNLFVPLILSYPGVEAGKRVSETVHQTDVARTLLDLAGLQHCEFPGQNLLERNGEEPQVQFAISANAASASVSRDGWHLILALVQERLHPLDAWERHEYRLFDLAHDERCRNDLAGSEPQLARELHGLLVDWLEQAQTNAWAEEVELSAGALEHLAGLGYVDPAESEEAAPTESAETEPAKTGLFPPACTCDWCKTLKAAAR